MCLHYKFCHCKIMYGQTRRVWLYKLSRSINALGGCGHTDAVRHGFHLPWRPLSVLNCHLSSWLVHTQPPFFFGLVTLILYTNGRWWMFLHRGKERNPQQSKDALLSHTQRTAIFFRSFHGGFHHDRPGIPDGLPPRLRLCGRECTLNVPPGFFVAPWKRKTQHFTLHLQ